jgi:hypothetical protein
MQWYRDRLRLYGAGELAAYVLFIVFVLLIIAMVLIFAHGLVGWGLRMVALAGLAGGLGYWALWYKMNRL